MERESLQQLVRGQRFALVELTTILLSGAVWMIKPEWGIWFTLIVLLPLAFRIVGGSFLLRPIDWLVIVFVITAWVGYWAAYDPATAWRKVWMVVTGALLYFSLRAQPKQNLYWVSIFLFCIGVGVSFYYFLTHDFVAAPRKLEFVNSIGRWIMNIRPQTGWTPIHPNYVAGTIAVTIPFIIYPIWDVRKRNDVIPPLYSMAVIIGLVLAGFMLVMATSRGVVLAIASGAGGWLLWRFIQLTGIKHRIKSEVVFPILLTVFLCVVVVFLYVGPARSGSLFSGNYFYGTGSRAELFSRSLYLLLAFPITGGGLGSFPGLYSQYLLDIPFFNVPNSHNLFLDVGIEQGLLGGLSILFLYLLSLWKVSRTVVNNKQDRIFKWVVLFSLIVAIVHGMVDDYLYNGVGTMLSLFLVGLSINGQESYNETRERRLDLRTIGAIVSIWVLIAMINWNQIRATWYANLGAVELAKVELHGFPHAGWSGMDIMPHLKEADTSLHSSLQIDPTNRSANQRLGLISMFRRDFTSAVEYLETAHAQAPNHRGIVKSLAYCYIWLGDMKKAQEFLTQIPEAAEELDVYSGWWDVQGRSDLSGNAILALDVLKIASSQP